MPLTIKPPRRPSTTAQTPSDFGSPLTRETYFDDREQSPEAPPASPLTPVVRPAQTAALDQAVSAPDCIEAVLSGQLPPYNNQNASQAIPPAQFIDRPPALPFSGDDSTDALALRAAISSLQFQRETAQRDLRALEEIKRQAIAHPDEFRQHLLVQGRRKASTQKSSLQELLAQEQHNDDDAVTGTEEHGLAKATHTNGSYLNTGEVPDSQQSPGLFSSFGSVSPSQGESQFQPHNFRPIPKPQEVVRCPPIEWTRYNVIGESLDKLHRQQQLRPGNGDVTARDSVVAARYDPFLDTLGSEDQRPRTWTENNRKDSGASATEQPSQRRRSSKAFLHG
ncbi:hypothetical protein MBLNU459_g7851t1 [Dothideomycetes sp. NU459]